MFEECDKIDGCNSLNDQGPRACIIMNMMGLYRSILGGVPNGHIREQMVGMKRGT